MHGKDSFDLYFLARGEGMGGDNARTEGFFGLLKVRFKKPTSAKSEK